MSASSSQHPKSIQRQKAVPSSIQWQSQPWVWPLENFWQEDQKQWRTEKGMLTEKESLRKRKETEKESEIQKGDPAAQSAEKLSEPQGVASFFSGATSSNSAAPSTASVGLLLTPGATTLIEKEKEIHRQDLTEVEEEPRMETQWFTRDAWVEFALLAEREADSAWVMVPGNVRTLWREQRLALLRGTWDSSHDSGNSRCNDHGAFETLLHTEAWRETQTFNQQYDAFIRKPLSERTRQLTQASGKPAREGGRMADS